MPQKARNRISNGSALPVIAAVMSVLSAIFTFVANKWLFNNAPIHYFIITVILPIFSYLLFAVFAVALAKKNLSLMILPVFLICIQHFLSESGLYLVLLGVYRMIMRNWMYDRIGMFIMIAICLLIIIAFVVSMLTFLGTIRSKIPAVIIFLLNIIVNIVDQIIYFIRVHDFSIPWYTISVVMFLFSFILLVSDIESDGVKAPNPMTPPFIKPQPNPPVMPSYIAPMPPYYGNQQQAVYQQSAASLQNNVNPQNPSLNNIDTAQQNTRQEDYFEKIKQLSELHNNGIITDEEFEAKKKELLERI